MQEHPTDRLSRYLDHILAGAIERGRLVGAVLLVSIDGDAVFERSIGWADREAERPMRTDTIFRMASMTKPLTCASAMVAVEEGLVDLDEPITTWLKDFRPQLVDGRSPDISVRQLMTHTAGLDYGFEYTRPIYRGTKISSGLDQPGLGLDEAMRRLIQAPLLYEPGRQWAYSLAIDVLGAVLEKVYGKPLSEIVHNNITGPLEMTDTRFKVVEMARLAACYADDVPVPRLMTDPERVSSPTGPVIFSPSRIFEPSSYASGGAGMAGTAKDFLCFLEWLRQGNRRLMSERGRILLVSPQLPADIQIAGRPGWSHSFVGQVLVEPEVSYSFHNEGTYCGGGAYGQYWFVDPVAPVTFVLFTNTAFEGCDGATRIELCNAIYAALGSKI